MLQTIVLFIKYPCPNVVSCWHFTSRPFTRSSFSWTTTRLKSDVYSSFGLFSRFIICCSGFFRRLLLSTVLSDVGNSFLWLIWLSCWLSTGRKWSMLRWPLTLWLGRRSGTIAKLSKSSLMSSKRSLTRRRPNSKKKSQTRPVKVTIVLIFRVQRIHRRDFGGSLESQHETAGEQRKRTRVPSERRIRRRGQGRGERRMIDWLYVSIKFG